MNFFAEAAAPLWPLENREIRLRENDYSGSISIKDGERTCHSKRKREKMRERERKREFPEAQERAGRYNSTTSARIAATDVASLCAPVSYPFLRLRRAGDERFSFSLHGSDSRVFFR